MTDTERDLKYAALATNVQFRALGHLLAMAHLVDIPSSVNADCKFRKAANYSRVETQKWLRNAWNTEAVLRMHLEFDEETMRFALQWAFSQAYYSCYCQVLALFVSSGKTERSHAAVLKKFGTLIQNGKYPPQISWHAVGGMQSVSIVGLRKRKYESPLYLELSEPESVENQVSQFLSSTRKMSLQEKKGDFNFRTKKGKLKKSLSKENWERVSVGIGPTSVLSLLHRKRIKANYREIDTFLQSEISGKEVLLGLIGIVRAMALVHESIQAAILGKEEFGALVKEARCRYDFLEHRSTIVENGAV